MFCLSKLSRVNSLGFSCFFSPLRRSFCSSVRMGWDIELIENNRIILVTMNTNSSNCLNLDTFNDLTQCVNTLNDPKNEYLYGKYKPVILRADPEKAKAFSAGMDLRAVLETTTKEKSYPLFEALESSIEKFLRMERQTIACIDNHAIAGGFFLGLMCDLRIGYNGNYKLGVNEIHVGIPFPSLPYCLIKYKMDKSHLWKLLLQGKLYSPKEMFEEYNYFNYFVEKKEELLDKCVKEALSIPENSIIAYLSVKKYLTNEMLKEHKERQKELLDEFINTKHSPQSLKKLDELVQQLNNKSKL